MIRIPNAATLKSKLAAFSVVPLSGHQSLGLHIKRATTQSVLNLVGGWVGGCPKGKPLTLFSLWGASCGRGRGVEDLCEMLLVLSKVNKVHISDRTGPSWWWCGGGGGGGGVYRTDNSILLRASTQRVEGLVMLEYKNTQQHTEASTARQWSEE